MGSATARHLLAEGAEARVLVRDETRAGQWRRQGAGVRVVDLGDRTALGEAITGCDGLFVLLPFDLTVDDLDAYADAVTASVAGAVADSGIPHVVMLSAGGADLAEGTGLITGLHRMEQALRSTGVVLTALRSGHFQEKVGDLIEAARAGVYPVFAPSADVAVPMVATRDLGATAAAALLSPDAVSAAVDVRGPAYSEREVAGVLGKALGRELEVVVLPEDAWAPALVDAGFRPDAAEGIAQLYRADARGLLAPRGDRSIDVATPIEDTIAGLIAGAVAA
ncbi:MAG: NAD(P)H-binding protein [Actinomycetota bacterium]|nr:NAD(P)H-binding protein [Actinomycetota bacterium]